MLIFKRGVDFINKPTTLLAMIDASIGGKNGINFKIKPNNIEELSELLDNEAYQELSES